MGAFTQDQPGYYINATLSAKMPGYRYQYPNGPVTSSYESGSHVGEIDTYVTRDGVIWWQLKSKEWVPQLPGYYDQDTAIKTSQGYQDQMLQSAILDNNGVTKIALGFGELLGKIMPFLLIALALYFISWFKPKN